MSTFGDELSSISWLPVLVDPPESYLPWDASQTSVVARSDAVRPLGDLWLASSSSRILDGQVQDQSLTRVFGWHKPVNLYALVTQLGALGALDSSSEMSYRQTMALAVPTLYRSIDTALASPAPDAADDGASEAALEALREQPCIWVGSGFVRPAVTALVSPLSLQPHLYVVSADLQSFGSLLRRLGVRDRFGSSQLVRLLEDLAFRHASAPLDSASLEMVLSVVQQLASPQHQPLPPTQIYLPDTACAMVVAHELLFDDTPWLSDSLAGGQQAAGGQAASILSSASKRRRVHPSIAHETAARLGAQSLRLWLLGRNADTFALGQENVEAFGQYESLTSRLHNILELYADGVGILHELIQNSDDAGATEVSFIFDQAQHGDQSLLSPSMREWQGPALCVFNNAQFTPRDLRNICSIGSNAKLAAGNATGRFGLGFNAVYHFTDVPSFISGSHLVFFDPAAQFLPGATANNPGLKIKFAGESFLEQFPDQFAPYLLCGCDMVSPYNGTLFRFPLRNKHTASRSQLRKEEYSEEAMRGLFDSLHDEACELLLFLKNVRTVKAFVRREAGAEPELLFQAERSTAPGTRNEGAIANYISGRGGGGTASVDAFYERLEKADVRQLPLEAMRLTVHLRHGPASPRGDEVREEDWLVCSALGRGARRICEMCLKPEGRRLKLMPWGGTAARLSVSKRPSSTADAGEAAVATESAGSTPIAGRAYCFLPLPSATGLPVHSNGYFELSANRRDIWHGDDMVGVGQLRSEWNIALLQDVLAPCYAQLLLYARSLLHGPAFYALWPSSKPAEPWGSLVAAMYRLVLDQPLLRCEADGGSWLSARSAIFADGGGFELPDAARELLLRRGMPLAVVPAPVQRLLAEAAEAAGRALSVASPEAVRAWLAGDRRLARESPTEGQRTRREGLELLRHCAKGLRGEGMAQLRGLRLVPLRSGGWARFGDASSPPLLLSASADDEGLLRPYPALVVDVHAEDGLASEELRLAAASGQTNVRPFSAALLVPMLPLMLPSSWHGCELVKLAATPPPEAEAGGDAAGGAVGGDAAGGAAGPPLEWLLELWALLGRQQSQVDLTGLAGWPLLPTRRGEAYALPSGGARETRMLEMSGLSDPLAEALERAGVLCVHPAANLSRRELRAYAPLPTACAVLRALQAATRARPGAAPAFVELSLAERRAVRGFLAERRPAEESELTNADLVPFLRSLPIFELHRAAPPDGEAAPAPAGECVPLQRGVHCVAPPGVPESLLAGGRFVRSGSESERRLLRFLGVEQPARSAFFRSHVFGRLAELPAEARDGAMVSVLRELHALGSEDAGFVDSLRELRFVPTAGGSLHRASELFHPKVHAAAELLGVEGAYPAGVFSAPDLLSALERLGLRGEVTRGAVVQSARSVQELSASDGEAALRRARALLRYVDTHAAALPEDGAFAARSDEAPAESVAVSDPFIGHRVSISGLIARPDLNGKVGLVVDAYGESRYTVYVDSVDTPETIALRPVNLRVLNPKADAPASDPASASRRPAYEELRQVQWLPVLAAAPIEGLPWRPHSPCVASPDNTRPASDVWLVSFCAHLLDGEVSSSFVLELFGWDKPPRPALLCAQLAEVGSTYSAEVGPDEAVLLEHCIGPIYEQLQQIVGAPEFSGVKAALSRRATIWTGPERGLLPPSQVSFDDDASLCRYLAVAPPSLSPFRTLLVALGVRESSFSADDFLKANTCFVRDYGSSAPLPEAALQECVLNLRLASARGLSPETSPVFLPDADGILRPSPELTFNDAPWMPSAGQAGTRFVHGSVEPELAERLGAQSLRQLLLLRDKFTDTFPCPSSTQIQEALAGFGHESNVLLDLLEVADVLGAKGVHFCCDRRLHPSESLLFPTLVEFQGPALCVFMPGVALTTEELCLLHQHSADRWFKLRGRTPRFGRRFASAYALGEVSGLVSGGQMFLCDPSGRYLPPGASGRAAEEADTGAPTSLPVGRVYPLVPGDLPRRFPDQFAPFSMFGFDALSGKPLDGTILRLPLRSEAQAASSKLSGEAWSATRLHGTLTEFRSRAQTTLISLETIEAVSTSEWLPDQTSPVRTLMVSLSMPQNDASQRGAVLHDSSWKKSGLSSLFNRGKKESMLVFDLLEVFRELKEEPLGEQASGEEEESARETNQRLAAHSSSFFSASSSMSFTPPVHPSAVGGTSIDHIDLAIEEGVEGGDGLGGGKGAGAGAPSLPHKLVAGTEEHRQCRWVVSEALAVEGSRALALEPQYAALGKVPHAAVAAQVACDGAPPTRREGRCFGAPLPLHSCSGLPVYVFGQFELSSPGREVLLIPDAADPRSLSAVAWNRALFACVAAAYAALLKGLPRMLGLPTSTSSPGSMYGFWPLSASVAHEELLPLLLGPLYRSLSTQPLFLAIPRDLEDGTSEPASRRQRPVLRRLEDGVVCPPAVSGELHPFVQTHGI